MRRCPISCHPHAARRKRIGLTGLFVFYFYLTKRSGYRLTSPPQHRSLSPLTSPQTHAEALIHDSPAPGSQWMVGTSSPRAPAGNFLQLPARRPSATPGRPVSLQPCPLTCLPVTRSPGLPGTIQGGLLSAGHPAGSCPGVQTPTGS